MRPDLAGTRVLIVGDWPPPIGGVAVHVRSLRDALRREGARPSVIDVGKGQHEGTDVIPSGRAAAFALRLATLATSHPVVHLHTSGANPRSWLLCAAVGLAARATGAHAVVTLHSGALPRYLSTPARALAARLALASYAQVVCVSDEISRVLRRVGAADDRHVVAPAFGPEGVHPAPIPAPVQAFRESHAPVLAAMVAPERHYGLPELIQAFEHLRTDHPRAGLVLFGPGSAGAHVSLPGVLGLGTVDRGVALGVMRAADVFVRPTLVDGDAVSVREALLLGTPVVATRVGTRPPEAYTCEPGNAADLARTIARAITDRPAGATPPVDGIDTVLRVYEGLMARARADSGVPARGEQ